MSTQRKQVSKPTPVINPRSMSGRVKTFYIIVDGRLMKRRLPEGGSHFHVMNYKYVGWRKIEGANHMIDPRCFARVLFIDVDTIDFSKYESNAEYANLERLIRQIVNENTYSVPIHTMNGVVYFITEQHDYGNLGILKSIQTDDAMKHLYMTSTNGSVNYTKWFTDITRQANTYHTAVKPKCACGGQSRYKIKGVAYCARHGATAVKSLVNRWVKTLDNGVTASKTSQTKANEELVRELLQTGKVGLTINITKIKRMFTFMQGGDREYQRASSSYYGNYLKGKYVKNGNTHEMNFELLGKQHSRDEYEQEQLDLFQDNVLIINKDTRIEVNLPVEKPLRDPYGADYDKEPDVAEVEAVCTRVRVRQADNGGIRTNYLYLDFKLESVMGDGFETWFDGVPYKTVDNKLGVSDIIRFLLHNYAQEEASIPVYSPEGVEVDTDFGVKYRKVLNCGDFIAILPIRLSR